MAEFETRILITLENEWAQLLDNENARHELAFCTCSSVTKQGTFLIFHKICHLHGRFMAIVAFVIWKKQKIRQSNTALVSINPFILKLFNNYKKICLYFCAYYVIIKQFIKTFWHFENIQGLLRIIFTYYFYCNYI